MNNNLFSTTTIINDDYMLFPYNDHYSSQSFLPFTSSSSINDLLIHSNTSNNHHHRHHHQFLQPSPFSQFESAPDFSLLTSFLPQNNGNDDYQTIPNDINHHASFPLNNIVGDQFTEPSETITHIEDFQRISSTSQNPTMKKLKKPSRTDRHSKIKTAKGTRDRRMRLSLDVARELFGLQDMLGFDKASKTVEWLLTQAKPEIIKIAKSLSHPCGSSSGDESQNRPALGSMDTSSDLCELASIWTVNDRSSNINTTEETKEKRVDGRSMRGKRKRPQPRTPILKKLSKDARAKARERAKDRTKEKMMMKMNRRSQLVEEEAHDHGEMIKINTSEVNRSSFEVTHCEEEIGEFCMNDRFAACNEFVMNKKDHISNESSYDIINRLNSSFPMLNQHSSQGAANSIEQQQLTDLREFFGKPRDLMYNYQNIY